MCVGGCSGLACKENLVESVTANWHGGARTSAVNCLLIALISPPGDPLAACSEVVFANELEKD